MKPEDEKFERIAQAHIASLKKAGRKNMEDAAVRAVHKVMTEFSSASDERLMEPPPEFIDALKYDVARRDSEFFTHNVEQPYDWTEWVCPDPKGYLMKCCDCGLVHEAEFGVVRYKSETEREDCDFVDDPNLQAVFRMRRSEQWSPVDTAHRAGGLPMDGTNEFNPDWDAMAVVVEEQQKLAAKMESYKELMDAHAKELDRAMELLSRAENEMRYAGWTKLESDNPARNGVYEQIKRFLK